MKERKKGERRGSPGLLIRKKENYKGVCGIGASKPGGKKLLASTDEFMYESKPWVVL